MKRSHLVAVLVVGLGVGVFAWRIWHGNQELAEQERKIAEQQIALDKQLGDLAQQQADVAKQLAAQPYTLRFQGILIAYGEATVKLGRSPNSAEELKPFLKDANDILSPRDQRPFEVNWGAPFLGTGGNFIWESTADQTGGRFVSTNAGIGGITARYVTEREFTEIGGQAR